MTPVVGQVPCMVSAQPTKDYSHPQDLAYRPGTPTQEVTLSQQEPTETLTVELACVEVFTEKPSQAKNVMQEPTQAENLTEEPAQADNLMEPVQAENLVETPIPAEILHIVSKGPAAADSMPDEPGTSGGCEGVPGLWELSVKNQHWLHKNRV